MAQKKLTLPHWSHQFVAKHVYLEERSWNCKYHSVLIFSPLVNNSPLMRRQMRFNYFVNKRNESRAFISLFSLLCWLREERLRKFNSKDFMSDERKLENEIIGYSVNRGKTNICHWIEKKTAQFGNWVMSSWAIKVGTGRSRYLFQ